MRKMTTVLVMMAVAAFAAHAGEGSAETAAGKLDMIKKLAGDWVEVGEDGMPTGKIITSFRLTAGGTAVEETLFAGTDLEMITLYYVDGDDLVLTHYCVNGNQPHMKAEAKKGATIVFKCAGGTNMKSEDDKHMHSAKITWRDDDHIRSEWKEITAGENSYTATFELARK